MGASQSMAPPPDPLPDIITTNLVNWFDFGKSQCWNGTSTTINDLTSNNYSGTLTGSSSNWSKSTSNGGYLDLVNGESTKTQITRNDSNAFAGVETGDFTIEFWINMSMGDGANMHMWMDFPVISDNARILWKNISGYGTSYTMRVSPAFSSNGGWQWRSEVASFGSGYTGWKHFVMSRNSGTIKVYLNDDEKDSWSNSHDFDATGGDPAPQYAIGNNESANNSMKARIAVYRLYVGKGLTSSEVGDNFDEEKSRFGVS